MDLSVISSVFTVLGAVASVLAVIVAIIISRRIPDKDILSHRQRIRTMMRKLREEMISGNRNYMLRIIDIDRFDKYYPEVFARKPVQSYLKGELDKIDIKGVWIINGIVGVKLMSDRKSYCISNDDDCVKAIRIGLIPYSWIIDVDFEGDECESSAILYCKFRKRYPIALRKYYLNEVRYLHNRIGFINKCSPFQTFEYYLTDSTERPLLHNDATHIFVRGDNPVYP